MLSKLGEAVAQAGRENKLYLELYIKMSSKVFLMELHYFSLASKMKTSHCTWLLKYSHQLNFSFKKAEIQRYQDMAVHLNSLATGV